jgi:hypothetical protein
MAGSTGIVLAAGAITLANEAVFAPLAQGGKITPDFNWRVIPATLGLALALAGLEKLAPGFATGLAWLILAAVLLIPVTGRPGALVNLSKVLGYK